MSKSAALHMPSWLECLRIALLILTACSVNGQVVFPPIPGPSGQLSGVCDVDPVTVNVLPAGYNRDINAPFSSTHLLNSSVAVEQAAALAGCQFLSFDPAFRAIIGTNPTLTVLASTSAQKCCTNGLTYLPETNEMLFAAFPGVDPPSTKSISKVDLSTGEVTAVPLSSPIGSVDGMNNGLGPRRGQVLACTMGNLFDNGLAQFDPELGNWTWLTNSFQGLRYNGIDDVISLQDGTVIFTDSSYSGFVQMQMQTGGAGQVPDRVYALMPDGVVRVLVDNLIDMAIGFPNGVEVSPDESILYLSATPSTPSNEAESATANIIWAYDLVRPATGGIFAQNKRVFAAIDVGYPDGFRVDSQGNMYTSSGALLPLELLNLCIWSWDRLRMFTSAGDGVQVFSPGGKLLGKIVVAPNLPDSQTVYAVAFAGNKLVITHNTNLLQIDLNTTGVISTASF